MACLGSVLYDPASAATASTASLLAMTAFDTTNLRITFTAPSNGTVLVRIRVSNKGATTIPMVLLGVLDGSTVKARQAPVVFAKQNSVAAGLCPREAIFLVTGLTSGNSYTWDAAYGVETLFAATQFGWGGPNDTTASNAYGAACFEIWETGNLLAGTLYDPSTAVAKALTSTLAMTALDTTNLRHSFTVPASGRVLVRMWGMCNGGTGAAAVVHFGVLESSTVKGRVNAGCDWTASSTVAATDHIIYQGEFVVSGLTPSANLTWDAAYAVETAGTSMNLRYGGPNNTTANDAYGGFAYEIWGA